MHTNRNSQESYLIGIGWAKADLENFSDEELETVYKVTYMTIQDIHKKMSEEAM